MVAELLVKTMLTTVTAAATTTKTTLLLLVLVLSWLDEKRFLYTIIQLGAHWLESYCVNSDTSVSTYNDTETTSYASRCFVRRNY